MGFEGGEKVRKGVFQPYQVNAGLISLAAPDAVFMHCLPAHRGLEVTPDVLDSPQSVALDQSENRMYLQKAILHTLFLSIDARFRALSNRISKGAPARS